jgi:hypothetical protein
MIPAPRCGKPMTPYEPAGGPPVVDPVCGRPEGHNPPCRRADAVERYYRASARRLIAVRRVNGRWYGRPGQAPERRAA